MQLNRESIGDLGIETKEQVPINNSICVDIYVVFHMLNNIIQPNRGSWKRNNGTVQYIPFIVKTHFLNLVCEDKTN